MIRKFIVPVIAVVTAGFVLSVAGCGGEEVVVKAPEPVVAPPPPPPPPPPDRDGDGIADAQDACPDVKGVPSSESQAERLPAGPGRRWDRR